MTITQVHYQKLVNLGDYQNERFGAWASVAEGETAEQAMEALQAWVLDRAGATQEEDDRLHDLRKEYGILKREYDRLAGDIDTVRKRWGHVKAFVEALGLKMPARFANDEELPF